MATNGVEFETYLCGNQSQISKKETLVIQNQIQFAKFWKRHTGSSSNTPTFMNWSKDMLVVVVLGHENTHNECRVVITSIRTLGETHLIVYMNSEIILEKDEAQFEPGKSSPFHIIKCPKLTGEIKFREASILSSDKSIGGTPIHTRSSFGKPGSSVRGSMKFSANTETPHEEETNGVDHNKNFSFASAASTSEVRKSFFSGNHASRLPQAAPLGAAQNSDEATEAPGNTVKLAKLAPSATDSKAKAKSGGGNSFYSFLKT